MARNGNHASGRLLLSGASLAVLALARWPGRRRPGQGGATAAAAAAAGTQVEEIVVTGFRGSLEQALQQEGRLGRPGHDPGRGHRQVPRPQPLRIDPAHPGRGPAARRRRGPRNLGARPGPAVHPRADQRHGGADHDGHLRRQRRRQPWPGVRLQRLRLGPLQLDHGDARPRRPRRKRARWGPRSTCRPRGRSTTRASPSWSRARRATTTSPRNTIRAAPILIANTRRPTGRSAACSRWPTTGATPRTSAPRRCAGRRATRSRRASARSRRRAGRDAWPQANAAFHPRFPRFDDYTDHEERLGATGSLQWRPTDKTLVNFDVPLRRLQGHPRGALPGGAVLQRRRRLHRRRPRPTGPAASPRPTSSRRDDRLHQHHDQGHVQQRRPAGRGPLRPTGHQVQPVHPERRAEFNDQWKADFVAGHAKSDFNNPIQTTLTFDQLNVQNYSYDYTQGRVPLLSYGSANLTSPSAWILTQIRERPQTALNTFDIVAGRRALHAGRGDQVLGRRSTTRSTSSITTELRRSNGTTANQESGDPGALSRRSRWPATPRSPPSTPAASSAPAGHGGELAGAEPLRVANAAQPLRPDRVRRRLPPGSGAGARQQQLGEREGHRRLRPGRLAHQIGGLPFRGNVGVRYVKTEQTATGFTFLSRRAAADQHQPGIHRHPAVAEHGARAARELPDPLRRGEDHGPAEPRQPDARAPRSASPAPRAR